MEKASYPYKITEKNDPEFLVSVLNKLARSYGMGRLAEESGLNRESLYKALRPGAKPRLETVFKVIRALNMKLEITIK